MGDKSTTKKISSSKLKFLKHQITYLIIVLIVISVIATIINPRFFTSRNFFNIMQQISVLGILTMCMSLLMISGGLDISIGNMAGLVGIIFVQMVLSGFSIGFSVFVVLTLSTLMGAINGVIISKSKVTPLIITLGMMYVFYGFALIVSGGRPLALGNRFQFLGRAHVGPIPFPIIIYLAVFAFAYLLRRYTKYGRRLNAIGGNVHTAYLSGISVDAHLISIYALSGLIAGLAGLVLASRLGMIRADGGTGYELRALAATIIGGITFEGGRGSIVGAFFGVLLLGVMYNAMNIIGVSSYLQTIFLGAIIVIATVLSNVGKMKRV